MHKTVIVVLLLALVVMAMPAAAQDAESVHLRVGHFSPGAGDVDIFVNGELSDLVGFAFGDVSSWMELEPGSYTVAVAPTGSAADAAVIEQSFDLEAGQWVTLAAVGEVARGTAALHPIYEDYSEITFGETRVTFFHAVPDLDAVNVQLEDGTQLVSALSYPDVGSTAEDANDGYLTLDILEGQRNLQVTSYSDPSNVLLTLEGVTLATGKNNLIVLTGLRANAVTVQIATDPETLISEGATETVDVGEGEANVRLAHFAPGAGVVDIYLNGEPAGVVDADFGTVSEWMAMDAGYYDVAIVPAGGTLEDAVITAEGVPVVTDSYVTLAAIGSVELEQGEILPLVENYAPINSGETRVAIFHAVPDLEPVNLQLGDGMLLLSAIAYPDIANAVSYASVDLVAGPRYLQLVSAIDPSVVLFDLPGTELAAGKNNLIVVAGLRSNAVTFHLVTDTAGME